MASMARQRSQPWATRGMLIKLAHANGNRERHGCATWAHGDGIEKGLDSQSHAASATILPVSAWRHLANTTWRTPVKRHRC